MKIKWKALLHELYRMRFSEEDAEAAVKAAATAFEAAGLAVVPTKPTKEMIDAGAETMDPTWGYACSDVALEWAPECFKAMVAKAGETGSS